MKQTGCTKHHGWCPTCDGAKSKKLLNEFVEYCYDHPEERFWEALKNWSKADAIIAEMPHSYDGGHDRENTYNWE